MDKLEELYDVLKNGTRVDNFLALLSNIFLEIHSAKLTPAYRSGEGRFKRLRDEITPASRFARQLAAPEDEINFPLDNGPHDCIIYHRRSPGWVRTIQITVAQGKERHWLTRELNDTGTGRGFLGLTDADEWAEFKEAIAMEPKAYETGEVRETMQRALYICACKKQDSDSHTLLIEAQLELLSADRWTRLLPTLSSSVCTINFRHLHEIFVVGRNEIGDICLQLK